LAEAARDGRGGEDKREEIETDTIDALADAATACGTVSEETVANAVDTLKSIFDEAASKLHWALECICRPVGSRSAGPIVNPTHRISRFKKKFVHYQFRRKRTFPVSIEATGRCRAPPGVRPQLLELIRDAQKAKRKAS
jgi:hypothetical protein